ncbi:MAG: hypothetical protein WCD86_17040 [Ktedonobacteraceae bacterium]
MADTRLPTETTTIPSEEEPEQPTRTKAQEIAAILDEPEMQFVDWEKLMGEGVVVRLHIKRVRFRKKLTFEDLGLHFPDERVRSSMEDIFRLGMKNLMPRQYIDRLQQIEDRARKLLKARSFETVWGPFIPVTGYFSWREKTQQLIDDYFAVRDEILRDYATIIKQVIRNYTDAARNAYRILNRMDPDVLTEREREREAWYLAGFRRKIRKMLPKPDDVVKSFDFVVGPTYIDLPALTKGDESRQQNLDKPVIESVTEEEQVELRFRQEAARQRQRLLDEMNRDVVKKAREQKERLVDAFLTTVITQLRGLLYEATSNVLSSLKKHDSLQPRAVVQLKNLVEQITQLNFYGDRDVERAAALIQQLVDRPREDRDLALIEMRLRQIATVMRSTLLNLEYEFREERLDADDPREQAQALQDTEKRELAGIARKPSRNDVREARLALGFTIPPWEKEREERLESEARPSMAPTAIGREERVWS